ncbi:hypothetical protein C8R44DRAFT_764423 [Mycena epipterygia]|nr:hypothetical protein C8R44DRAFT_764423 [Mycena epipterygia]
MQNLRALIFFSSCLFSLLLVFQRRWSSSVSFRRSRLEVRIQEEMVGKYAQRRGRRWRGALAELLIQEKYVVHRSRSSIPNTILTRGRS